MNKLELFNYLKNNGHGNFSKESYFKTHFEDFYVDFIDYTKSFPEEFSFHQKLYHYLLDDKNLNLGMCKKCGVNRCHFLSLNRGYRDFCSVECKANSEDVLNSISNTKISRYGDAHYNNLDKMVKTNNERYGVSYPMQVPEFCKKQNEEYMKHIDEINRKIVETNLEKYGVERPMQIESVKKDFFSTKHIKRMSIKKQQTYRKLIDEYNTLSNNVKRKGTISKIELNFYKYLISTFGESNIIPQYVDERYPYFCDFYIKPMDLFIEIQGYKNHGYHPFDSNNPNDILTVEKYKYNDKDNFINTWTVRDVEKRTTAKINGLNYLEIFSTNLNVCVNEFNSYLKKLKK